MSDVFEVSQVTIRQMSSERLARLRGRAAARLAGTPELQDGGRRTVDALSVLHALASSPATAPDALKLLHELQVHQVELDLQAQELDDSRAELEAALRRQIELYDGLPVACFQLDSRGLIRAMNRAGVDMLGLGGATATGTALDAFFSPGSAPRFRALLSAEGHRAKRCPSVLHVCPKSGPERPVHVSIAGDADAGHYLVCFMAAGDDDACSMTAL